MSDDYEDKLAAWKMKHGVPEEQAMEEIPAGELRMIAEDAQSSAADFCWTCGDSFSIKEMIIETSPYAQMEDDAIEEDGYINAENRVRTCKACVKGDEHENNGIEEGQEP